MSSTTGKVQNTPPAGQPGISLSPEQLQIMDGMTKVALKPHQIADLEKERYKMKFDEKLENGPTQDRGCTDIICCLIFILFMAGWIFIFAYGVSKGDPGKLMTPFNEYGKGCGYNSGYKDYPNIFFYAFGQDMTALLNPVTNPNFDLNQLYSMTFCVDKCPPATFEPGQQKTLKEVGVNCREDVLTKENRLCSSYLQYNTTVWFGSFCVPNITMVNNAVNSSSMAVAEIYKKLEDSETLQRWVNDVKICWWVFIISAGITLVIAIVYMYMLRWCAGIMTWLMLLALIAVLIIGGSMAWRWAKLREQAADEIDSKTKNTDGTTKQSRKFIVLLKVFAYIFWITGGFMVCFILCCYHKISLVIAIIKTTSEFVGENCYVLFVPVFNTFAAAGFSAVWIVGTVYLFAVGDIVQRSDFPLARIVWDTTTRRLWYVNLFAILWVLAFILSLGKFVIGAACSIWYFNQNADGTTAEAGQSPVRKAYYWAFRYHLGSIAFGSFLLAVIWFIRIIFEYIYAQLMASNKTISKNKFIQIGLNALRCCLDCFERLVRFINKQAFIQIGLTGKSFCPAAKDGFCVVVAHPIEFGLLSGLANLFMWLGNAMMVGGTLVICFIIMRNVESIDRNLSSPFWPLLLIGFISYMIADLFSNVYMVACYAVLQCYYVDLEITNKKTGGNNGPSKRTPEALRDFFKKGEELNS